MKRDLERLSRKLSKRPEFLEFVKKLAVAQARADAKALIEATAAAHQAAVGARKRNSRGPPR